MEIIRRMTLKMAASASLAEKMESSLPSSQIPEPVTEIEPSDRMKEIVGEEGGVTVCLELCRGREVILEVVYSTCGSVNLFGCEYHTKDRFGVLFCSFSQKYNFSGFRAVTVSF